MNLMKGIQDVLSYLASTWTFVPDVMKLGRHEVTVTDDQWPWPASFDHQYVVSSFLSQSDCATFEEIPSSR